MEKYLAKFIPSSTTTTVSKKCGFIIWKDTTLIPFYTNQICCERRLPVPRALVIMGLWLRKIMLAEEIPFFKDMHRYMECSHSLALNFNAKKRK